jgi:endonuclease YncB( thermonuclease family)
MNRRSFVQQSAALSAVMIGWSALRQAASAADLPEGVPEGSVEANVVGYIDGDKFKVTIEDKGETVLLISANAPESGDCFFDKSSERLESLLPMGATVYLEQDGESRDGKDRLLRYVWLPRDGKKAMLVDERMIADGFSTFAPRDGHDKRDARLKKAEQLAKDEKRGMWADGACDAGESGEEEPAKLGSGDNPAPIGTTLTTDGQEITVTSAYFTYEFGFVTPKGGYVFLVLETSIRNVDDAVHGYEESRFSAKDLDSGAEFDDTFTFADAPLGSGELSPGEYVYGQVVLEVQESAKNVRIKYDAKFIGGGEVYWLMTR